MKWWPTVWMKDGGVLGSPIEFMSRPNKKSFPCLLDGSAYANWTDMAFTAPFAAAAVVAGPSHQAFLDALWPVMVSTTEGYYQDTVNLLCQIFVSGNWWKP